MMYKAVVTLPYQPQTATPLPGTKTTVVPILSPFVRFNLKGNRFVLKADGPALVNDDKISLHFSLNAGLEFRPAVLEFGNVTLPLTTALDIVVRNTGNVTLAITRLTVDSAAFFLAAPFGLPALLEPGAELSARIGFKPIRLGPHIGSLTLWSNQLRHPALSLSGYGSESRIVIDEALIQRVLTFFNSVKTAGEIANRISDDPSFLRSGGATYGIDARAAQAILRHRKTLPGVRFTSLEQLDAVSGIGPDTLHDILYSFTM